IKGHDRRSRGFTKRNRLPANLIGIARFHDIRLLALQDFADRPEIEEHTIARALGNYRGSNGTNTGSFIPRPFRFFAGNNQDVLVARPLANVGGFFVNVAFHAPAERRIKLSQVAELQEIADCRLPIPDFRDAAMMATSSVASLSNGWICLVDLMSHSTISSSQKAVSSASSSTTPIFAMNSARERARHADR